MDDGARDEGSKERLDRRNGEQAGEDRVGGALEWSGLSGFSECDSCLSKLKDD